MAPNGGCPAYRVPHKHQSLRLEWGWGSLGGGSSSAWLGGNAGRTHDAPSGEVTSQHGRVSTSKLASPAWGVKRRQKVA